MSANIVRWTSGLLAFCIAAASSQSAAQDPQTSAWMTADTIRSEFSGQPLAGIYPSGLTWTEDIYADGTTDYREGAIRRAGQWWLTEREFCFRYPQSGMGGCFRIVKVSDNCYELYQYGTVFGSAEAPPREGGSWNGRMWRSRQPSTCAEQPSV